MSCDMVLQISVTPYFVLKCYKSDNLCKKWCKDNKSGKTFISQYFLTFASPTNNGKLQFIIIIN